MSFTETKTEMLKKPKPKLKSKFFKNENQKTKIFLLPKPIFFLLPITGVEFIFTNFHVNVQKSRSDSIANLNKSHLDGKYDDWWTLWYYWLMLLSVMAIILSYRVYIIQITENCIICKVFHYFEQKSSPFFFSIMNGEVYKKTFLTYKIKHWLCEAWHNFSF